ncbi:unnamed protein product [Caenorhabditis angaria]|uniref:Uncharacterized protein n=1 Tax=Caenorhabditis angaria TaxID=860376 RepID=A0A9P1IH91_9PELO|nr:unnamed protein product [Caenorhabditis angaria]
MAAEMVEQDAKLVTLQANSMLRIYKTHDFSRTSVETRLKSEILPGQPTAILPLSLNSAYLIGSSQGCIKMMC